MDHDDYVINKKKELIDLVGSISSVDGDTLLTCRIINDIVNELEIKDDLFNIFKVIDSCTDHIPFGKIRKKYSSNYIKKIELESKKYLNDYFQDLDECKEKILIKYPDPSLIK